MGKRRKGFKQSKNPVNALKNAASSDEEDELEAILDDEIGRYNTEKDEALLSKKKKSGKSKDESDNEEEVYGLNLDSDDEEDDQGPTFDSDEEGGEDDDKEDDEDDNDEDVFGKRGDEDDGIPDSRAWGKKARIFHSTDYVDQDFGGMEGEDAERALMEEEEAKAIQKRLTAELDESDFMDFLPVKDSSQSKKKDTTKEFLKLDLDNLSVSEKRKLVERQCPEIPHLLEELKEKLEEVKVLKKIVKGETRPVLKKFYETKLHLYMNYCVNISFFLYQRSSEPQNCAGHPAIKRILQYRKLIDELKQFNVKKVAKSEYNQVLLGDRPSVTKSTGILKNSDLSMGDLDSLEQNDNMDMGEAEKRKITYEMAKNKGLMPKRKKEQRNPRVKHREKFRKAKIRRKGQIRTPRTETERYGGEISGIKANVTKSIKLK